MNTPNQENKRVSECCDECKNSKFALKGKIKEKMGGICGLCCECHRWACMECQFEDKEHSQSCKFYIEKEAPQPIEEEKPVMTVKTNMNKLITEVFHIKCPNGDNCKIKGCGYKHKEEEKCGDWKCKKNHNHLGVHWEEVNGEWEMIRKEFLFFLQDLEDLPVGFNIGKIANKHTSLMLSQRNTDRNKIIEEIEKMKKEKAHDWCIDSQDGCEECADGIYNQALDDIIHTLK